MSSELLLALHMAGFGLVGLREVASRVGSRDVEAILSFLLSRGEASSSSRARRLGEVLDKGLHLKEMELVDRAGVELVSLWDGRLGWFPPTLRPPLLLYCKGRLEEDRPLVAVVGTRRATAYGRKVACSFAGRLAERGFGIVSGGALGVDGVAHRAALDSGGFTAVVLGCGLDVVYPPQHRGLFEEVSERGALLSELPFGAPPLREHFPRRNRLIAGLSRAVLVVEAPERSGALITARLAMGAGIDVYSVPSRVFDPMGAGSNALIRDGALVALSPDDVLPSEALISGSPSPAMGRPPLSEGASRVLELLELKGDMSFDLLAAESSMGYLDLLRALSELEGASLVELTSDGMVRLI